MQTSASNFSCTAFDTDHTNKVIKGNYVCAPGVANPRGAGTKPTTTTSSSSSKSTGKSAAGHVKVNYPAVVGGACLLGGLLQLVL